MSQARPELDDGQVALYKGDCRDVLPVLDLSEVSVIVADPPYGDTSLTWDRWPDGWIDAIATSTPRPASLWCFGSMRMFLEHHGEFARWRLAQDLVWEKHNGSGFHADRFKRVHEHLVQWYRGEWVDVWKQSVTTPDAAKRQVRRKVRPPHTGDIGVASYQSEDGGPRLMRSVQKVRSCHGHAVHPTQKPLGIIEPLLRYSCRPGSVVLDPFAGASSTLVLAKQLGFRAIGIEADPEYVEVSVARLSQGTLPFEATDQNSRPVVDVHPSEGVA